MGLLGGRRRCNVLKRKVLLCVLLLLVRAVAALSHTNVLAFARKSAFATPRSMCKPPSMLQSSSNDVPEEVEGIGVGIDLGTTRSCVAVLKDGIPEIVSVPNNGRTLPSVVGFDGSENVLVGLEAIENESKHPGGTYRNVKRVIGTGSLTARETAEVVPNLRLKAIFDGSTEGNPKKHKRKKKERMNLAKQLDDARTNPAELYLPLKGGETASDRETVKPETISAHVLRTLFDAVEAHTGKKVTRAVIGVPAYFHDEQRDATVRACELAGVSKVKLLREPEAAALAYGIGKEQVGRGDDDEMVLVFDLGGGTYDVSVLNVGGGVTEVVATGGNACLGGSDFDARIAQHFSKILKSHGAPRNFLAGGGETADAMIRSAEAVRIHLSNNREARVALPKAEKTWSSMLHASDVLDVDKKNYSVHTTVTPDGVSNSTHVIIRLTRKQMEFLCQENFQSLLRPLREVAIMSGALLPGDSSPTAAMAALELDEEIERSLSSVADEGFGDFYGNHDDLGAASTDTLLQLQEFDLKERKKKQQRGRKRAREASKQEQTFRREKRKIETKAPIDVKVRDGISGRPISQVVLVGGATRMPAVGRLLASVTGKTPQKTVNPDEAVALGCAIQAGLLDGNENLGEFMVVDPFQAALMRAVAQKNGILEQDDMDFDDEFDDELTITF